MVLKGQAKTDYQREYMRQRRHTVRPVLDPVRPIVQPNHIDKEEQPDMPGVDYLDADGYPVYDD